MSDDLKVAERWFSDRIQQRDHRRAVGHVRHAGAGLPVGGRRRRGNRAQRAGRRVRAVARRGPGQAVLGRQPGRPGHDGQGRPGGAPHVAAQPVPRVRPVGGGAGDPRAISAARASTSSPPAPRSARSTRWPSCAGIPDVFGAAIGMSGSYRIERFYDEAWSQDLYFAAPLQFVPGLEGPQLDRLRQRQVLLASGEGDWEDIGSSWQMAAAAWAPRRSPTGWTTGARLAARMVHLAPDAPAVPRRAHLTRTPVPALVPVDPQRHRRRRLRPRELGHRVSPR